MIFKNCRGLLKICSSDGCNKILFCHNLRNRGLHIVNKPQIPVCYNSNQAPSFVNYRNSSYLILFHKKECITYGSVFVNSNRIVYHSILCTLHLSHMLHLHFDGHIFVNYPDTSFTGNFNCKCCLCNGIHSGGNDRRADSDLS